ncbi:IS66 family transposase zinc-finger binding domain-containing protein [Methylobacterium phyllosphaerae]
MALDPASLPDDVDALKRMIVGMARDAVHANTLIEKLRGELARLKRAQFGVSSEKLQARVEKRELAIEALKVAEAVEAASRGPGRRPLPDHLPRETVAHPRPCACPAGGGRLRRIGEDVTESLDYVPGRFKVVRQLREAFSCRACETVVQAPASHHAVPRGRASPGRRGPLFDDVTIWARRRHGRRRPNQTCSRAGLGKRLPTRPKPGHDPRRPLHAATTPDSIERSLVSLRKTRVLELLDAAIRYLYPRLDTDRGTDAAVGVQIRPPCHQAPQELHPVHSAQHLVQAVGRIYDGIAVNMKGRVADCDRRFSEGAQDVHRFHFPEVQNMYADRPAQALANLFVKKDRGSVYNRQRRRRRVPDGLTSHR